MTGIPVLNQALSLYNAEDDVQPAAVLDDDEKLLGYYSVRDWQFLKVYLHLNDPIRFTDYDLPSDCRYKPLGNVYRST